MSARYLLRFDDLCPTMNWDIWTQVEALLTEFDVKPIVAVIPDNQDEHLMVSPPRGDFWDRARDWQKKGWQIALHGHQHRYVTAEAGIMRINRRSEFAGLPYQEQRRKLEQGLQIFAREGIAGDTWIAPAHSFDATTVAILRELGVRFISDGFSCFPYKDALGMVWVPQQLWGFRKVPVGIWTVCLHHNGFSDRDLLRLRDGLQQFRHAMTTFAEVVRRYGDRRQGIGDRLLQIGLHAKRYVDQRRMA